MKTLYLDCGMGAAESYGMSSALGATLSDLPQDVPQGSSAMDYTTQTLYFFDGVTWH